MVFIILSIRLLKMWKISCSVSLITLQTPVLELMVGYYQNTHYQCNAHWTPKLLRQGISHALFFMFISNSCWHLSNALSTNLNISNQNKICGSFLYFNIMQLQYLSTGSVYEILKALGEKF